MMRDRGKYRMVDKYEIADGCEKKFYTVEKNTNIDE